MKTLKQQSILLFLFLAFTATAQNIERFSIDNGGASVATANITALYTIGEVNIQELQAGNIQVSEGFIQPSLKISIHPKLFLQGPMLNPSASGLMNDNLRIANHLPTTSPYTDEATTVASVFNTGGTSGSGMTTDNIVDWIWIEIRQATDNTKIIRAQSALLQRDGDIVALDGITNLKINVVPSNYFVVLKHRNHLGVMSSNAITLNDNTVTSIDFTDPNLSTFGSNAQVQLPSSVMALWAGDTNQSNKINFIAANSSVDAVKDFILADPANFLGFITFSSSGYLDIDVNLDGYGKFIGVDDDSNIIKDNVFQHPANFLNFPTFTINPTVPLGN